MNLLEVKKLNLCILRLQIIYTSIMSGMMLMYVITIGSYFNYILKNKMFGALQDYSLFRKNTRVQMNHSIASIGQVVLSVVSLVINYDLGVFPLIVAVMVPLIILFCHIFTGFGKAEQLVVGGKELNDRTIKVYLSWNKTLHIAYTIFYMVSAALLLNLL